MPELPEVETIRRGLAAHVLGKRIANVQIRKKGMVRGSARRLAESLQGAAVADISRKGKLLIFHLQPGEYVLVHLKMTGQLIYVSQQEVVAGGHQWPPIGDGLPNKYTHITLEFSDGSHLYFNDQRQFGFMQKVDEAGLAAVLENYGPDPLEDEADWEYFYQKVRGRKASIKAVLLNQKIIAGIGNIYADEILFTAKVRPGRRTASLKKSELQAIYAQIFKVFHKALRYGGTTFQDYRDVKGGKGNFIRLLKAYGREGKRCRRCREGVIRKRQIAQRGTHWCSHCQA